MEVLTLNNPSRNSISKELVEARKDVEVNLEGEFEGEWESNGEFSREHEMRIMDAQRIIQPVTKLLGKAKKCQGRKTNKQRREDESSKKGLISVTDFLKMTKGAKASLGGQ